MKKIEEDSIAALYRHDSFKRNNTEVIPLSIKTELRLHNNLIATLYKDGLLIIEDGGWQTNTTKSRLNALHGVTIQQVNFQWYLNGTKWNGDKIIINDR